MLWTSEIRISLEIDDDSEDSMLVRAHASTVYAVGKIKSETNQILPTVLKTQPNVT
jgi:hypothetical protein